MENLHASKMNYRSVYDVKISKEVLRLALARCPNILPNQIVIHLPLVWTLKAFFDDQAIATFYPRPYCSRYFLGVRVILFLN